MFVAIMGDAAASAAGGGVPEALIGGAAVVISGLLGFLATRSYRRRRTGDAPSPPDLLATHDRLTVTETHQRDGLRRLGKAEDKIDRHGEAIAGLQAEVGELRHRVKRIEDR